MMGGYDDVLSALSGARRHEGVAIEDGPLRDAVLALVEQGRWEAQASVFRSGAIVERGYLVQAPSHATIPAHGFVCVQRAIRGELETKTTVRAFATIADAEEAFRRLEQPEAGVRGVRTCAVVDRRFLSRDMDSAGGSLAPPV